MRIKKINSLILPKTINNKEVKKQDNIQNNFNTQISSNAIKNYALSQITFKGKKKDSFIDKFDLKGLPINQYRQQVIDKLSSSREFSPNYEGNKYDVECGIIYVETQEIADAKIELLDKYTNDKKWQNSKFIQENIGHLFKFTEKPNFVKFVDKILTVPELAENKDLQKQILNMSSFEYIGIKDDVFSYKLAVLDKFLSDPKISNNKKVRERIVDELSNVNDKKHAEAKIQIMDKYLKNKEWNESKNDNLEELFIDLLGVIIPDVNNARDSVIDLIIKNPELYNTDKKQSKVYKALAWTSTPVQATVAKKFLSDPEFLEENLDIRFPSIIGLIDSKEYAESVILLFDKIISEPKLRNNEDIQKRLNDTFYLWPDDKKIVAESKLSVMEKYLSDEKLQKTKGINIRLARIIEEVKQPWQAEIVNCVFSDAKLYKDRWIQENMINTYRTSDDKGRDKQTAYEVQQRLRMNRKEYNQENLEKLLSHIYVQ